MRESQRPPTLQMPGPNHALSNLGLAGTSSETLLSTRSSARTPGGGGPSSSRTLASQSTDAGTLSGTGGSVTNLSLVES